MKKLPIPEIAVKYYTGDDLYLFGEFIYLQPIVVPYGMWSRLNNLSMLLPDEFQIARIPNSERPIIDNEQSLGQLLKIWFSIKVVEVEREKERKFVFLLIFFSIPSFKEFVWCICEH